MNNTVVEIWILVYLILKLEKKYVYLFLLNIKHFGWYFIAILCYQASIQLDFIVAISARTQMHVFRCSLDWAYEPYISLLRTILILELFLIRF